MKIKIFYFLAVLILTMFSSVEETFSQNDTIPDDEVETKIGWETYRASLVGIVGYNSFVSKQWSFVPELHYVIGLTGSGSLRYEYRIESRFRIYGQAGLGITPIPKLIPTGIFAIGVRYKLTQKLFISSESRLLLLSDLAADLNSGGTLPSSKILNVKNFPPWVFSLGISF